MAAKTEPDPPAAPDASPPADERMDRIEATQAEQGGMLQAILDRLPGNAPDADPAGPGPSGPAAAGPADIQGEVRRQIAEASARAAEEARAKGDQEWRASVDDQLEKLKPEQPPRDPQAGIRGALQRITFGSDAR